MFAVPACQVGVQIKLLLYAKLIFVSMFKMGFLGKRMIFLFFKGGRGVGVGDAVGIAITTMLSSVFLLPLDFLPLLTKFFFASGLFVSEYMGVSANHFSGNAL